MPLQEIDHCASCCAENSPQEEDLCPECGGSGTLVRTWGEDQAERYRTGERYDPKSELGKRDLAGEIPELDGGPNAK